jgi:F-type H+-transporting ATPase subunit delta
MGRLEEHGRRLQVAVADAQRVQLREATQNLLRHTAREGLGHRTEALETIEQVAADLGRFSAMLTESADLARLVRSPAFSAEEQVKALGAVLAAAGIGGLTAQFLKLVATKRRLFAAPTMIADFGKLLDAARGVSRAEVTVAEPLSPANLEALRLALREAAGSSSVEMNVKVDPAIIGGLIVKLGSRMVDGSLRTKLNSIRTRMKEVG